MFFHCLFLCLTITGHHHVSKDVGTEPIGSIAVDDGDNSWLLLFHESVLYCRWLGIDEEPSRKWARHRRASPRKTIGVPRREQISSPVTSGDHVMNAEKVKNGHRSKKAL